MTDEIQKVYYRIGEVSEMLNVLPSTIHFWISTFKLPVRVGRGKKIRFLASDIAQLKEIQRLLREEGYTVKGAVRRFNQN